MSERYLCYIFEQFRQLLFKCYIICLLQVSLQKKILKQYCYFHIYLSVPLPKYKVSGIYKPQICRKFAARLRLIVAARLPQTRFSYANYFSGALFWHTMCATSMQLTAVAHCSGTQCAPQVCGAQLSCTVLVHNVCHKFAAHNCRALFWYTMCAASLWRTIVGTVLVHNVRRKYAAHSCRTLFCVPQRAHSCHALRCSPPHLTPPPSPTPTPSLSPHPHIFF